MTSTKSLHRLPVARDLYKQLWQRDTEASHARYNKAGMCKWYSLTDLLALEGSSTMNHVQPRSPSGHRNTVFSSHTAKDNAFNLVYPVKVRKSSLFGESCLFQRVRPAES